MNWRFLNYGYASLAPGAPVLALAEGDERDRDFIQLYDHVAATAGLAGKDVLEVSSGRGGGCSFMAKYLGPRSVTGLDRSERAVAFSAARCNVPNVTYRVGDAESLPFADASFDAAMNVESSHCYGSMVQFLQEVRRVLRPGGYFLWADFRDAHQVDQVKVAFKHAGLVPFRQEDITANVLASLDRTDDRKVKTVYRYAPRLFIPLMLEFAGVRGSAIYRAFERREKVYLHYGSRKEPT